MKHYDRMWDWILATHVRIWTVIALVVALGVLLDR